MHAYTHAQAHPGTSLRADLPVLANIRTDICTYKRPRLLRFRLHLYLRRAHIFFTVAVLKSLEYPHFPKPTLHLKTTGFLLCPKSLFLVA